VTPRGSNRGGTGEPLPVLAKRGIFECAIVGNEHGCGRYLADVTHTGPRAVVPAAAAARGGHRFSNGRETPGSGNHLLASQNRDERPPKRNAAHERFRAVDGIDQPTSAARSGLLAEFFSEHTVRGKSCVNPLARGSFRNAIGHGHG